jgi:hypothetical protein
MNTNTDRLWQAWVWAERAYFTRWLYYSHDIGAWQAGGASQGILPEPQALTPDAGRELNRLRDDARVAQERR